MPSFCHTSLPARASGVASTSASAASAAARPHCFPPHRPSARASPPSAAASGPSFTGSSGPRPAAWRAPGRRGAGGEIGWRRAEGGAAVSLPPPAAGKKQPGDGSKPDGKKKKKRRASGYGGPSPRQALRQASIRAKATAWRAARVAAGWPGIRHALAAAASSFAKTAPLRSSLSASWDALRIDYGAFLAAETRRTWAWAAEHRVEKGVAREQLIWLRSFALTVLWAALAPPTIAWVLGVPFVLQSLSYGVLGQVKSPVLWAVLLVCQGLGKWPVGMPLMPWV